MGEIVRGIIIVCVISVGIFLLTTPLLGVAYVLERKACHAKWGRTAQAVEFGFWQGCMVKMNGKWIPADNYREVP